MHSFRGLALVSAVLAAATPASALPRPDLPDEGAPFLRAAAPDITRLVRAVRADPGARGRYAQVFHVPAAQIPGYLQRNFVAGTLLRTDLYTVSLVSHRGTIFPAWMTLRAGTPVFVARRGPSMLLCATGDPVAPLDADPSQTTTPTAGIQVLVPTEEEIVPLPTTPAPTPTPAAH